MGGSLSDVHMPAFHTLKRNAYCLSEYGGLTEALDACVDWSRLFVGVLDPAAAERSIEVNKPCHIARKILAVPTVRLNTQYIRNADPPLGLQNIKHILPPLL
jgi:hypothetical protein